MSFWAEDPQLFLHKGHNGVVHVLRCKKETMTSSSSSMLMKPEDFTNEGVVTDLGSLTGGSYNWEKDKYDALVDYIYPRHLLVNCHGSVIVELEPDEKSAFALLFKFFWLLFHWLLVNLFHKNKKAAAVVYMRALDILDMGCYGPGSDHPGRAVPVRAVKYLQDGMPVPTESAPKEMELHKEVETLRHELLLAKETIEAESTKEIKLMEELAIMSNEVETLQQQFLQANEQIEVELAKEVKLNEKLSKKCREVETLQQEVLRAKMEIEVELAKEIQLKEELAKKSQEVETWQHEVLQAKQEIEVEIAKETKLMEELTKKAKDVETLEQKLAKEKAEVEYFIRQVGRMEIELKWSVLLPLLRIYTKSAMECSLTVRNGHEVVLGQRDPRDDCQYWVKDSWYGDKCAAKEKWDFHCYALVNRSTGQALKPGVPHGYLEMVPYDRNLLDKSILWKEEELSDGYKAIKKATDLTLNLDATGNHGPIGDGTTIGVWCWAGGDNQKWGSTTCTKPFTTTIY